MSFQDCYRYTFTVFTPTYNRAHTLGRVYESLKRQTFRDFEWLIIDDGSSDGTGSLVETWQNNADFPIYYLYQENQGKHIAFNHGVAKAQGELFLTFDSDDECIPVALERFKFYWESIPESLKNTFSAVTACCQDQFGCRVGDVYPKDIFDSDSLESHYKYKIKGEKWGFQRTDVLKEFPFPEPIGIRFVPESTVWKAISRKYKTRYVNELLRIYWRNEVGSLSFNRFRNASSYIESHKMVLNEYLDWFWVSPQSFLSSAVNVVRYSLHNKKNIDMSGLGSIGILLCFICFPAGILLFFLDKYRINKIE